MCSLLDGTKLTPCDVTSLLLHFVHHDDPLADPRRRDYEGITLRNLPPNLDKAIRNHARAKRMSVNKAVIGLLEAQLTQDKTKRAELHHDLDDLSGSWSADIAAAFDEALAKQRAIDPDMWK